MTPAPGPEAPAAQRPAPVSPAPMSLVQATCVLVGAGAVLIRGAPGSGKSSLAAALLALSGPGRLVRLVADDAVLVRAASGRLVAVAPAPIRGAMEVRGLGIVPTSFEPRAVVRLVADLVAADRIERLPAGADARAVLCGVDLPRLALPAGDPAARERIVAALALAGGDRPAGAAPEIAAMHKDSIRA
ncbi:hypothetical protein [Microbaculum marinum]|uniref:HPr kinase/phosphorylase C-terminal domain-containing protein n=1 Tax=Microbaculum marinum TaxID=1764581 RepID=A0AAW9S625_9HYPH